MRGRDDDAKAPYNELRYVLADGTSDRIAEFFAVDAISGAVYLKKSLMMDEEARNEYGVSWGDLFLSEYGLGGMIHCYY